MKYLVILIAILSLTACQTGNLTVIASQVQAITAATCKFVPTAATIGGILSADPRIATAEAVAEAICAAVAPQASGPGSSLTPGYVSGVKVEGKFVK